MAYPDAASPSTSEDALLGGVVRLRQPTAGYRAAIDPVLLAAAVPARAGEHVLDIGAGTGAAALCLAARVRHCRVTGLERDPAYARLAAENAALNGFCERVGILTGDLSRPPAALLPGSFDHVMANPPHLEPGRGRSPADKGRAAAHVEDETGLRHWIRFGLKMARPRGTITLIHRAERLGELLGELAAGAGEIVVFPLWPGAAKPARRVIVRARPGVASPLRLGAGLLLHGADGGYTDEAEAVLRGGRALEL